MNFAVDWVDRVDFVALRQWRREHLQEKMRGLGIDGVISFRAENIRYFTGMRPLWWPISFTSRNCGIVAQGGAPILFVTSGDWARCQQTMTWLPQENIRPCATMEDDGLAKTMVWDHFLPALKELGLTRGRLAIDAVNMSVLEELKAALPEATLVPGDACLQAAKVIKNADEIALMRATNHMASIAHKRATTAIEVGVRECEVLAEAMHALYSFGMEVPQCNLIVASGDHTAPIHRFASDRIINNGELVFMDLGGCFNGYFSDVTRTVILGQPNDRQKEIYAAVYDSMMKAHEVMRPGVTNKEVNDAVRAVQRQHGFEGYLGVLGHTIGTTAFDAPLIGDISATGEREFELEPGMVFSVEPTITIPGVKGGGGVRLEDCVLITNEGSEVLSSGTPYCDRLLGSADCSCGHP